MSAHRLPVLNRGCCLVDGLVGAWIGVLFVALAGCGGSSDPYAGTWASGNDRVVLNANGTGVGSLFGTGREEPLTWHAPQGHVAVTFGANPSESRTFHAACDGQSLVFRSGDSRRRLERTQGGGAIHRFE
jgi:hypothetical protein